MRNIRLKISVGLAVALFAVIAGSGCTYESDNDPVAPVWLDLSTLKYYGQPHVATVEFTSADG